MGFYQNRHHRALDELGPSDGPELSLGERGPPELTVHKRLNYLEHCAPGKGGGVCEIRTPCFKTSGRRPQTPRVARRGGRTGSPITHAAWKTKGPSYIVFAQRTNTETDHRTEDYKPHYKSKTAVEYL